MKIKLFLPDFYILTLRVTRALNESIETVLVTSASSVHFSGLCCARYSKLFLSNSLSILFLNCRCKYIRGYVCTYIYIYLTFKLHCFELNHLTDLNANRFSTALLNWFISSKTASVSGRKHLLPYKVKQLLREKNFSTTNSVFTSVNVNFTSLSENYWSSALSCYY